MTIGHCLERAVFVQTNEIMTKSHFSSGKLLTFGHFWNILFYIERDMPLGSPVCTRRSALTAPAERKE